MRITLKQLTVFDAIARTGNVSKASNDISLSQSATSMSLNDLEVNLGAQLFNRHGKRLKLNDYGRRLQPQVRQLLQQALAIEQSALSDELQGQLRIGASSTIGNYLIPTMIASFVQQHPLVHIDLVVGNTEATIDAMLKLQVDVGLIEGLCHSTQLNSTKWRIDNLKIFCGPTHPLSHTKQVTLSALKKEPWILREPGSGTREIFALAARNKFDSLNVKLELGNSEAIKQAVKSGWGVGCLSEIAIAAEVEHGELCVLPIKDLDLHRDLFLIEPKMGFSSKLHEAFLNHIAEQN